jgi:hypothetical protein
LGVEAGRNCRDRKPLSLLDLRATVEPAIP